MGEKLRKYQTKKFLHYAKKIRAQVKLMRHEKEKAILKEIQAAAKIKRK